MSGGSRSVCFMSRVAQNRGAEPECDLVDDGWGNHLLLKCSARLHSLRDKHEESDAYEGQASFAHEIDVGAGWRKVTATRRPIP
jgi:hypothetical protein